MAFLASSLVSGLIILMLHPKAADAKLEKETALSSRQDQEISRKAKAE